MSEAISDRIVRAVLEHRKEWGRSPQSVILGPCEWAEYRAWVMHNPHFSSPNLRIDEPTHYGARIVRSTRPGIEVEPSDDEALWMADMLRAQADNSYPKERG